MEVRPATEGDYEDVLAINRYLYDGLDYIPALYHNLLRDKRSNCFVGILNGKVVAFCNFFLLDGGKNVELMATRTHTDYKGKGLAAQLEAKCRFIANQRHPDLEFEYRTNLGLPAVDKLASDPNTPWQMLFKENLLIYFVTTKNIRRLAEADLTKHCDARLTSVISSSDALNIINTEETWKGLSKYERIMCFANWQPLENSCNGWKERVQQSDLLICTRDSKPTSIKWQSFSSHTRLPTPHCTRVDIIFHGESLEHLQCHIQKYFQYISQDLPEEGKLGVLLVFPREINLLDTKQFLQPYLGSNHLSNAISVESTAVIKRKWKLDQIKSSI